MSSRLFIEIMVIWLTAAIVVVIILAGNVTITNALPPSPPTPEEAIQNLTEGLEPPTPEISTAAIAQGGEIVAELVVNKQKECLQKALSHTGIV